MTYSLELQDYWSQKNIDNQIFLLLQAHIQLIKKQTQHRFRGISEGKKLSTTLYKFDMNTESFFAIDNLDIQGRINHRMFFLKTNKFVF